MPLTDQSYGIVPIHLQDATRRYLVVQHLGGHWSFPKGHPEKDETPEETARRELREETGLVVAQLLSPGHFHERYTFTRRGKRVHKTATFFVGLIESPHVTLQQEELLAFAWGTYEETMSRITFEAGKAVLEGVEQSLLSSA